MFSKAFLVPFVALVATVFAKVPTPSWLEEAFIECSITVTNEARQGAVKYYKCGDFWHLLSDPIFRGPKSGASDFERCFVKTASQGLGIQEAAFIDSYDVEAVIKELKCNPSPVPSEGSLKPESLLSKIGNRFRQLQQRFHVQFDEMAKKVKPEWIRCFNSQRNISIHEFFCDRNREEMTKFKLCILSNNQDSSVPLPDVPSRLQKITDWIVSKVFCKPESRNARISARSIFFTESAADLANVLGPAIGVIVWVALCGSITAIILTIVPSTLIALILVFLFMPTFIMGVIDLID